MTGRISRFVAAALLVSAAMPAAAETPDRERIADVVEAQHDNTIEALRNWIALPTIALMVFVFLMTHEADNTLLSRGIYFLGLGGS